MLWVLVLAIVLLYAYDTRKAEFMAKSVAEGQGNQ